MNENAIWLLNFNYDEMLKATYDFFSNYGKKIGADINIINERLNPDWHITYEKSQIYEKGKNYKWNLLFDTDILLHENFPDLTRRINPYCIGIKDSYNCRNRFSNNDYFIRDGRYTGVSGVFAMASFNCHDLFKPLPGKQEDYLSEIHLDDSGEKERNVKKEHFITEYWLSYNIAKYGLKYQGILTKDELYMLFHPYGYYINKVFHSFTYHQKIQNIKNTVRYWESLK